METTELYNQWTAGQLRKEISLVKNSLFISSLSSLSTHSSTSSSAKCSEDEGKATKIFEKYEQQWISQFLSVKMEARG